MSIFTMFLYFVDHNHYSGQYLGACHYRCNLECYGLKEIPVSGKKNTNIEYKHFNYKIFFKLGTIPQSHGI